jgi:sn-glycerol 3-phosphate transport system ATP-binding protein
MAEIAIRQVRKSYGRTEVVHGVDLDIGNGEFVVILGPSGCGKSTLLRMIAGLEDISAGEIAIDGARMNEREPRERGCAMVFQNYALYPHMSVAENIGYALKVAGVAKAERTRRVEVVAATVGLDGFLDRKPGQLSGGQRQRVAMARAMIREPKVFLFDEPLSNLDAKLRVQMRIEIRRLHRRLATTSVFVTHDQVEAMTLADRMVVMNAGHIEQIGAPGDVYHRPATRFVASFIGMPPMNLLPARVAAGGVATLASGARLALVPGWTAAGEVEIGIRPEDVLVDAEGEGGNRIPFLVEFIEELGAGRLAHGTLEGIDFIVQLPAGVQMAPGETHTLLLAPHALHLFDAATGRRCAGDPGAAGGALPLPAGMDFAADVASGA